MNSIAQLRDQAREHSRQLAAIFWLTTKDLAARWGVSLGTVREIDRELLPYLMLGKTSTRRFHPDDVAAYEATQKHAQKESAASAFPSIKGQTIQGKLGTSSERLPFSADEPAA